jgi:hypothetical protein
MQVENINNLSNGISLRGFVHAQFGKLSFAFKPTVSIKQADILTVI